MVAAAFSSFALLIFLIGVGYVALVDSSYNEVPVNSGISETPMYTPLPEVVVVSPENKTYEINDVQLNIVTDLPAARIVYRLDWMKNVPFSGNTTLTNLHNGTHWLSVYVLDASNDPQNNKVIEFKIGKSNPPNPTQLAYASFGPVGGFTIRSPVNFTAAPTTVILNFTGQVGVGSNLVLSMTYSLDGQESVPFPFVLKQAHDWDPFTGIIAGSVTLSDLSEGSHSITVYGNLKFNSTPNVAQATVYFNVQIQ